MSPEPKKRWRQFSLRGLLVVVTLSAAFFAWIAWRLERARIEGKAAEAIVRAGGEVAYSNPFYGGVSRLTPYPPRTSWSGAASQTAFGADPFRRMVSIKLFDDESASLVSKYSLTSLQIICLNGGASITDQGLAHIRECSHLRVLALERSGISDGGLENIRQLKRLEELWLCNTQVSDAGLEKIARLPSLYVLDIRGTPITSDGLKVVASMPAITLLYLDSATVSDEGLRNLSRAPKLVNLWLGDQSSAKLDLAILGDFPSLVDLALLGSGVTDEALRPLENNKRLERLQLQDCTGLTDESLSILARMPKLQMLHLLRTPFSVKATNEFKTKRPACTVW